MFPQANSRDYRAVAALLFTALLWSSSGLFVKIVDWPALTLWGARGFVSAIFFLIFARPTSWRFTPIQWLTALSFMGAQLFFFFGNKVAPAANTIFLAYTAPIYLIPLGIWFLGERPQRSDWTAMAIIFSGLLLFFGDDFSGEGIVGNLWGVATGVLYAVMTLGMRLQKAGNPADSIFLAHFLTGLIGIPLLWTLSAADWSLPIVGGILYMGFFQIGFSFILYSWAIKRIPALESLLITMLEPIANPLLVFWVLGEVPGRYALVGALFVIIGVLTRAFSYNSEESDIGN